MSDYKDIFSGDNERYERKKENRLSFDPNAVKPDTNNAPLTAEEINGTQIPDFTVAPADSADAPETESDLKIEGDTDIAPSDDFSFDKAPDASAASGMKDDFVIGSGFSISDDYASQIRSRKERVAENGKPRPVSDRDVDINKVSRQTAREKKKKEKADKRHGPLYTVIWVLIILLVSGVAATYALLFANDMLGLVGDKTADVQIEQGMTLKQIADELHEKEIIDYPFLFRAYVKFKKQDGSLKYGGYSLRETMGYDGIIEQLQKSNERETVNVVIPDGATVETIGRLLEENDVCTTDQFYYVLKHTEKYDFNYDFVKEIPEDNVLYIFEGYLYPDTYNFFTGAEKYGENNCVHALNKMLSNFRDKLNEACPEYKTQIESLKEYGIDSLHDALSLASIVQMECSGFDSEMPGVAAVFLNRLVWETEPHYLGSTPTFYYPDNRYNTNNYELYDSDGNRVSKAGYEGLPPGPQCSMTASAIKAVLYPDSEALAQKYYYFVTDKNHKFYYNKTLKQHESTIASLKKQGLWA